MPTNSKEYNQLWENKHPWFKFYRSAYGRCNYKKSRYYKRGIKFCLTHEQVKDLWFKDKAFNLERPSLDRIEGKLHYTFDNCRFIEFEENLHKKPCIQKTLTGKIIRRYSSVSEAARQNCFSRSSIHRTCSGKYKQGMGFRWEFI